MNVVAKTCPRCHNPISIYGCRRCQTARRVQVKVTRWLAAILFIPFAMFGGFLMGAHDVLWWPLVQLGPYGWGAIGVALCLSTLVLGRLSPSQIGTDPPPDQAKLGPGIREIDLGGGAQSSGKLGAIAAGNTLSPYPRLPSHRQSLRVLESRRGMALRGVGIVITATILSIVFVGSTALGFLKISSVEMILGVVGIMVMTLVLIMVSGILRSYSSDLD